MENKIVTLVDWVQLKKTEKGVGKWSPSVHQVVTCTEWQDQIWLKPRSLSNSKFSVTETKIYSDIKFSETL